MAKERKLISIDEEYIKLGNELVNANLKIQNFSHLIETLIEKESKTLKRGKKQ